LTYFLIEKLPLNLLVCYRLAFYWRDAHLYRRPSLQALFLLIADVPYFGYFFPQLLLGRSETFRILSYSYGAFRRRIYIRLVFLP